MLEKDLSLDEKKAIAKGDFREVVAEFNLESSESFSSRFQKMQGMDHGPNHREGDPAIHTQLVEFELNQYLQTQEHGLSEHDQRLLRLAVAIHDLAKADTQKFDVASNAQRETLKTGGIEIDESQVKSADDLIKSILTKLSGQDVSDLSKSKLIKLKDEYRDALQAELIVAKSANPEKYPALLANFRDHDQEGAKLVETIVKEAGIQLTDEENEDLKFIVENHMDFLDPGKLTLDGFRKLFVRDGVVDARRIELIKIHAYADDKGTHKPRKAGEASLLQRIDENVERLKNEYAVALKKEKKEVNVRLLIGAVLPEGMEAFLVSKGIVKGPNFGKAAGQVRELVTKNVGEDFDIQAVDVGSIRSQIDSLKFE